MKFSILVIIFCLLPFLGQAREIDLSELSLKTQKSVNTQLPGLAKSEFKISDLDQLIKYLVTQELFDSVEIQLVAPDVYKVFVGKTKKITQILFSGIKSFSEAEIRREFAISEKSNFDQQALIDAGERIRKFYNEHAFNNAVINIEFSNMTPQEIEVRLSIIENKQTIIKTLDVNTDNKELKKRIEKIARKKIDDPLTEGSLAEIRKEVREYFGENRYFKAELIGPDVTTNKDESEAQLKFTIEKSYQYNLSFRGNLTYSERSLKKALDLDNFYSSNPNIAPELATKIKNYYLSEGYARVEVQGEESETGRPFERLAQLKISEGPKVKIKNVEFSGKYSLNSEDYKKILFANSSELIQRNIYNRDEFELALKNLITDRRNQGYLKAKSVSSRTVYNKERDQISIYINLDEGPLTLVQKVSFEGNSSFTEDQLREIINLEDNRPLKLNALDQAIFKIKVFYRSQGFLEMSLLNENEDLVKYNEDSTQAQLNFKIYEGPKIFVGSILIQGSTLTKDFVIMKELEFKVGDVLTPQNLEESTSRLQRVGHFYSVDIRTLEEKTQISRRTVIVRVLDREPGLFNTGIGVSNERQLTLRGFLGVAYRNISGTGRGVSARLDGNYNIADIKYLERKVTIGYLEPYLLDTRTRGRVNFTQSNTINPFDDTSGVELRQFAFSIEQDITSHILISMDLWNKSTYRDYYLNTQIDKNRTEIASVGPTLDIDFRDHPFNPTKGTFTRFSFEYASPGLGSSETIEFTRGSIGFTHYLPITKTAKWVWANSIRGSHLKNLSTNPNGGVPYDKKGLILGGTSTLRGFSTGESFPNNDDFKQATGIDPSPNSYLLTTEAVSYLIKSELRFPIWGNWGGAIFYDGGSVTVKDVDLGDTYRDNVGVAARYITPVGAVSFELGLKLDRKESRNESLTAFHFSIGTF